MLSNQATHDNIKTILNAAAGQAQAQGNPLMAAVVATAGSLHQMVIEMQNQIENAPAPTVTNNEITVNGGSTAIPLVNVANGARIAHPLNTVNILVSIKDAEGYQDPYTSAKADGPNHILIKTPGNETFTGTAIIDVVTLLPAQ